ncbi:hypothetical protein V7S79_06190 [Aquirufa sp. ROCK-SH2]
MKKLIAFYILTFSFLLIQDGMMLNVKKNVLKWEESSSLSIIDLEDEGDFDDSADEEIKDIFYAANTVNFSFLRQLLILNNSDFLFFVKDVQLELLSPPPQLS